MKPIVPQATKTFPIMSAKTPSLREVLVGSAAAGTMVILGGGSQGN